MDETSAEWLSGYGGKLDVNGNPVNYDDYQHWLDSLPHIWVTNPALSHFIIVPREVDATYLETWIAEKYTAEFFASLEAIWDGYDKNILVKPVSDYVSPLMTDKYTDETQKTAPAVYDYYISLVNTRLADYSIEADKAVSSSDLITPKSIDVGPGATDRASTHSSGYTVVNLGNPANDTGTLDTYEVWMASNGSGFIGATFSGSGGSWTARDSEAIGSVTSGSKQTFSGLSITVETNDCLGYYFSGGTIERDTSGQSGYVFISGDYTASSSSGYNTSASDDASSIYATGNTGGTPDIVNAPTSKAFGVINPSSTLWASGSEPSWPLADEDAFFTVTNNGSIAVDISANITDWTGGVGWTNVSGSPGENQTRFSIFVEGDGSTDNVTITAGTPANIISSLAASADIDWEIRLETGTFTDGVGKTMTVTLIASAS